MFLSEIRAIIEKYKDVNTDDEISTPDRLRSFSIKFYTDVAEIYDSITRIRNLERNPSGFNFNDAAILGLLIRIWKLLKEVVYYYEKNNAQIIGLFDRPIFESAITAKYLLVKGDEIIEDYRKCSYKDRLKILTDAERSPDYFATPPGIRLKKSFEHKMDKEGLTINSFEDQKNNKWKISGKNFYELFKEVEPKDRYKYIYGIPSESIHCSWNESMDYDLRRNDDGTFSCFPFYQEVDNRFIFPILIITRDPYLLWLNRINAGDKYINKVFEWIQAVNIKLYDAFELHYKQIENEE